MRCVARRAWVTPWRVSGAQTEPLWRAAQGTNAQGTQEQVTGTGEALRGESTGGRKLEGHALKGEEHTEVWGELNTVGGVTDTGVRKAWRGVG